ncbi:hypothetical protein LTR91_016620 [Friedmanniomyces endolithicus]|uniref:COP9 signalosome complex subunit 6 n=1 Tax=Friedmanniomyces endolithicus TaxID=329885 RepID=A0AAN6K853_9PEZI|nr:hypothetical protein LTR94_004830 [Friedmanniomyces endolithicus]KAK0788026.1 hypothetical protein LTR38_011472 [Friedmanniomyces endolithicus]KAK0811425.1 hypothetical protein LTR59_001878 [Friedmanniomyces endolithicus]KAK0812695.1 hypothetical protein LTR75_004827 [Friedmanniomyces endolithicus]KAK0871838.1 hypothetical protein LTS02_001635 [Friedmanniomyces endolithicus]
MAGKSASINPLVLTGKAPDTTQHVQLHPLALLTISDYITRHTLRSQEGPIVGAIIGEQDGRSFTLEHAFECKLQELEGDVLVDSNWFAERLEQYRDVHKAPPLDLVAMFALGPVEGPQKVHLPMLKQVQQLTGNDSVMLLLFHGELVDQLQGGKLPISLYESVQEQEGAQVKFRELSFEVETGEAEMIGVDTVAKAGTAATAVQRAETAQTGESSKKATSSKGKGKAKDKDKEDDAETAGILSPEDDELIASLTAKANAIRMLNDRINLIRSYLTTMPSSYLTDATSATPPPRDTTNHILLRNVNSLLSRVPLLAPQSPTVALSNGHEAASAIPSSAAPVPAPLQPSSGIHAAGAKERQDVHLTSLLAVLSRSVAEAQAMGSKFHIVSREKDNKSRPAFGGGGGGGRGGGAGGGGRGLGGFGEEGLMGEVRGAP